MKVTVVYITADAEHLIEVDVEPRSTVAEAIRSSGVYQREPSLIDRELSVGIWNRAVSLDHVVVDGDRIEIYRPLVVDPKQARRLRAELSRRRR